MADEEKNQTIEEVIAQAEEAIAADDARAARRLVDTIAEMDPHHPKVHGLWEKVAEVKAYSQGLSAAKRQRFDVLRGLLKQWPASTRQTERYQNLTAKIDEWVEKHRTEAEEQQRAEKWFEARESWAEVLRADPDNEEAKQKMHDCMVESIGQEARELMRARDWENAITKWDEMLHSFPESEEAQKGKEEAVHQKHLKARKKTMLEIGAAAIVVLGIAAYLLFFYYPKAKEIDRLGLQITSALTHEDWRTAQRTIPDFTALSPDEPEIPLWRRRVENLKRQEARQLTTQIDSLVGAGDWDRAQVLVDSISGFVPDASRLPTWREAIERGRSGR